MHSSQATLLPLALAPEALPLPPPLPLM